MIVVQNAILIRKHNSLFSHHMPGAGVEADFKLP